MVGLGKSKKQGRNSLCDCGSGVKFKKCCGKQKDLTLRDMMKCLYLLLQGASETHLAIPKGPIPFSRAMLDEAPDDVINEILVAENSGFLILTVKKKNKPVIEMPTVKQISEIRKIR